MKKLLLLLLLSFTLSSCGEVSFAQQEVLNPNDPNYNIELNDLLATNQSGISKNTNTVSTIASYFSSGILQTRYGGTGQNSSNWTAGDLVYLSGTGTWSHASPNTLLTGVGHSVAFSASTTWTAPAGVTGVILTEIGGGGGGGSGSGGAGNGGGGGAGAYVIGLVYPVTPGNTYTVTVGAAGAAGAGGGNGGNGGTTTFDTISVLGGSGGHSISGGGTGGAGGVGSSPLYNASASTATAGLVGGGFISTGGNGAQQGAGNNSGAGGGSPFGSGANGLTAQGLGNNAAYYGAGGGGASGITLPGGFFNNGGTGGGGLVVIQY